MLAESKAFARSMLVESRAFKTRISEFADQNWPPIALVVALSAIGVFLYMTISDGAAGPIALILLLLVLVLFGYYELQHPQKKRTPHAGNTEETPTEK